MHKAVTATARQGAIRCNPALIIEVVLTGGFLLVILGSTDNRAPYGFAPIAIGLALTLIHLISIPVTNTSVNPARGTGQAIIVRGLALQQLWLFWVAPLLGGAAGGGLYRFLFSEAPKRPDIRGDGNDAGEPAVCIRFRTGAGAGKLGFSGSAYDAAESDVAG